LLCATKVCALSTSLMLSVPPVLSAASVSVRFSVALDTTAASLLPVMLILTVVVVPSALVTVKLSLTVSPVLRLSLALLAT
jgi:hypothetical protein